MVEGLVLGEVPSLGFITPIPFDLWYHQKNTMATRKKISAQSFFPKDVFSNTSKKFSQLCNSVVLAEKKAANMFKHVV